MADGEDRSRAGQEPEPEPEPGEEFEIVDRSQLPGPGELRRVAKPRAAAEGWSAPILTLARRATGNLSASCGSALRAAAGLGGADGGAGGADGAARAGRLRLGATYELSVGWVVVLLWEPGWQGRLIDSAC